MSEYNGLGKMEKKVKFSTASYKNGRTLLAGSRQGYNDKGALFLECNKLLLADGQVVPFQVVLG